MEQHVGQNVEGFPNVLVDDLDVEPHQFLAGEGVQVAADGIHLPGDVFGRPGFAPLEQHVFNEVRDAVLGQGFAARTRPDPQTYGDGTDPGHDFGDDLDAVR